MSYETNFLMPKFQLVRVELQITIATTTYERRKIIVMVLISYLLGIAFTEYENVTMLTAYST
jgi:hypothetical protein